MNRDFEVFMMAVGFLRALPIRNTNDYSLPILSTCQMFGSGKTQLGYHFLDVLTSSRFARQRDKLAAVFGNEAVVELSGVTYVHVNLKNYTGGRNRKGYRWHAPSCSACYRLSSGMSG